MKNRNFNALILGCLLLLASCNVYQEVKVGKLESFDITSMEGKEVKATLNFQIENPNKYPITLFESDVLLKIDEVPAGTIVLVNPVRIEKESKGIVQIPVSTQLNELESILGNAMALMFKTEIKIQANGFVKAKGLGIQKNIPVEFEKLISRNQLSN